MRGRTAPTVRCALVRGAGAVAAVAAFRVARFIGRMVSVAARLVGRPVGRFRPGVVGGLGELSLAPTKIIAGPTNFMTN